MALEERKGNEYYYRKRRTDEGRVVSEYSGRGAFARMIAAFDAAKKRQQQDASAVENARRQRYKRRGQGLNEYERLAQIVTRAALVASGCKTHKGQWRKRRESVDNH